MVSYGAYGLELGGLRNPGPGFWPFWAGVLLSGFSLLVFIFSARKNFKETESSPSLWANVQWGKFFLVLISMVVYTSALNFLGFILSTFFLMMVLFKTGESQKWPFAILASLVTVCLSVLIFDRWFQLNFPRGFWGF